MKGRIEILLNKKINQSTLIWTWNMTEVFDQEFVASESFKIVGGEAARSID